MGLAQSSKPNEAFFVIAGQSQINFRDGAVTLNSGEMLIVSNGVEHKPFAAGIDMSLLVVERLLGTDITSATARYMEYPWKTS